MIEALSLIALACVLAVAFGAVIQVALAWKDDRKWRAEQRERERYAFRRRARGATPPA